ncbi:hypothetical protein HIM_12651 [Hirsutella minnesotensis 3608]|uniref:Heterokaryon incompatibility domain-containing protein n=1 Tax=Hirsutella minnesotensis 3608 TaxID=1043627 RepID=A0A0F7ZHT3_9HYPO|nr:hypothetical protein HIM_12651 [Hirsutella minnesotensis 3608]
MPVLSLRRKDPELESRDSDGHTPLIRAAWQGNAAAVQQLLDKGAKTESTDAKQGRTPLSFAALGGHVAIVRLLLDNGAKIEAKDDNSQTPLSWAAWGGDDATLRLLISRGAKIESKDKKQGRTPLSFAAWAGSEAAVRVLIDHGAEIEAKDNNGRTPTWWADWGGHVAVVRLLTRSPSSAAAINSQQVSHRLGLWKENASRVLASSAQQRRDEFKFVWESSEGKHPKLISLCEACRSVNLSVSDFTGVDINSNRQSISGAKIIKTASLAAIKAAQNCSLCRLVAFALEDSRSEWSALDGRDLDDSSLEVHVRLLRFPWLVSGPFNVLDLRTAQPFHSTSFGLQLFPSEAQGRLIGRSLGPQVSIPLVKRWVAKCMEFHGQDCGQSKSHRFREIESMMLAVDVQKERIVAITANDEYLVLSYVWGKIKSLSLRKENFKNLQQPGGLSASFKHLPRTIQDAITVTKQLGHRYIWIDSLCIVQDDVEFKSKIIDKMDLVYGNAFMTLIAASGSDSNSGLPGIGTSFRTSEQQFADISQDLRLIYARTHNALLEMIWASRAWTYVALPS